MKGGSHHPAGRWGAYLPAIAVVLLGMCFGLIPLWRGELFLFNDNGNEYYPHTEFLVRALREWVIPQWWSQVGTGIPVIAEGEAHYTPIRLLLAAVLSAPASFMAEISVYFALAGLGTYLFLRRVGTRTLAASAGAIGFMFGSQFVVYVRDMGLLRAACFLPWVMWLAESSFRERRAAKVLWMAPLIIALQFLAGNPVFAVISLVAGFCYLILRSATLFRLREMSPHAGFRCGLCVLLVWGLMVGLGIGIAGVQVVPTLLHAKESVRAGGFTLEYASNSNHSKPTDFPHAFFPYVYDLQNPFVAVSGFYDGALIGVAVFFALWAVRRAAPPVWCLFLSAGLATLLAMGSYTPLYSLLWHLPFLDSLRFPLRYQFWASFCFACLGALGLDAIAGLNGKARTSMTRSGPVLLITGFVLAIAALFWRMRPGRHRELLWCVLLLAASTGVLLLLSAAKKPLWILAAINLLLLADLGYFRFYADYAPRTKTSTGLSNDGLAGWLHQDPARFRVFALLDSKFQRYLVVSRPDLLQGDFRLQNILYGSSPTLWGLESVKYHGSLELRRFERVIEDMSAKLQDEPAKAATLSPFMDFLQAKYVVARSEFSFSGWEKAREEGGMTAWRVPDFHGGEFLVGKVEQEKAAADTSIVQQIESGSIDFRRTAIIASDKLPQLDGLGQRAEVRRHPARYDEMGFDVISDRPALLVIPSNYYPGWTATVNGKPARIYRTDWIGMGLLVGPGESNVSMHFTVPGFTAGVWISILSLVAWLGIAVTCRNLRLLPAPDDGTVSQRAESGDLAAS